MKKRFKYHNLGIAKIVVKKKPYFEWDSFLSEIFNYVVEGFKKIEK
jgi:hypothetical protein